VHTVPQLQDAVARASMDIQRIELGIQALRCAAVLSMEAVSNVPLIRNLLPPNMRDAGPR
jgi:hypothetical protein